MQVHKPQCIKREWESEEAWDLCAALFITAAVRQPPNLYLNRGADCLPRVSLLLFLCFPQEDDAQVFFFRGRETGLLYTHKELFVPLASSLYVYQLVCILFFLFLP